MKNSIIISFTIALTVLLLAVGYGQERERDHMQMRKNFEDELNLTDNQQDKIKEMRLQNQKDMIDLKADLQKKKIELKELLHKGDYSRDDFMDNTNAIISSSSKIEITQAQHRMDIYELLDENQKEIWNERGFGMHQKWEKFKRHKEKRTEAE